MDEEAMQEDTPICSLCRDGATNSDNISDILDMLSKR